MHMMAKKRIFLLAAAWLCFLRVDAQVFEVTNAPPITPQNLITNIFLGDGVEVLSVNYQGAAPSVGFFKDGLNAVGMDRGIVMTTGRAVTQGLNFGVAEPGNAQASVDNQSNVNDPDLLAIASGQNIFNATIYTISFIPISDTLRFRYAFGSEEYPEFVCSEFNDIFGFFISGPGISGPFSNGAVNIARIPGTNLPVTINNVNSGNVGSAGAAINCTPPRGSLAYSQFYNDNNGSAVPPVYDGITDVFTAEVVVQPCQVYTIKLAICDVSDAVYDSGVFLEAKSFGTSSLDVNVATLSLDGSVAEGCSAGTITFAVPNPVESDTYIDFSVFGTAINGIDYELIPDTLFIPAGQSSVSFDIIAIEDFIVEGEETILIDVQRDPCNRDTFQILIRENPLVKPNLGLDTAVCSGAVVQLDGTIPIALPPPPTFTNTNPLIIAPTNVAVFSNIAVNNVLPNTLSADAIRSICIDSIIHPWIDDLDLFLITPGGQFLELSTDNGGNGGNGLGPDFYLGTCFTPDATVRINFPGPFAPPSAVPFTGNWLPEGQWSDIWGGPTNGLWRLQLLDDTNGATGSLHGWTITFNPVYDIFYRWVNSAGLSCSDCPNPTARTNSTQEYILEVTDSYGCTTADSILITAIPLLDAPDIVCATTSESLIQVAWGPVPAATAYEINVNNTGWITPNGSNNHLVTGLSANDILSFEIRALGACPGMSDTIQCQTLNCSPPALSAQTINATCIGRADGSVTLTPVGASGTLNFVLDNQTNNTGIFSNLPAGNYTAVLTDDANCPTSVQFTIGSEESLDVITSLLGEVRCHGEASGRASVSVDGGTAPYTYAWDNGETLALANTLSAGSHTVTITDINGCQATSGITIPEPNPISLSTATTVVSCFEGTNGTATVSASGGVSGYVYQWSAAAGNSSGSTASGLSAGTYAVTVTDANNCSAFAELTIAQPQALSAILAPGPVDCFGESTGTITSIVAGGTGPYAYTWSNGASAASLSGVPAGSYALTITDANDCTTTLSTLVSQPAEALTAQWLLQDPPCFGDDGGSIAITASGGSGSYTYTWSGSLTGSSPGQLSAGNYSLTIADQNDCQIDTILTLINPPLLSSTLASTPVSCFGGTNGTAMATVTGGTGTYQYAWSNGQTDNTAVGLSAGLVTLTVTDANGCTAIQTISVGQASLFGVSLQTTDITCHNAANGTATVQPGGGTPPYAYFWSDGQTSALAGGLPPGTFTVTVTDANGCEANASAVITQPAPLSATTTVTPATCSPTPDGSAGVVSTAGGTAPYSYVWSDVAQSSGATVTGLVPGAYTVTITDANQCILTESVLVSRRPDPELTGTATAVRCFGGSDGVMTTEVNGMATVFTYTWSRPGVGNQSEATGLPAGVYTVTVTDNFQCRDTLLLEVTQPALLSLNAVPQHIACAGIDAGSIGLQVSGGVMPYRYLWSHGDTIRNPEQLPSGLFSVTVTDANGCTATTVTTIIQTMPVEATFVTTDVDCFGAQTGAATVLLSGGAPPFNYAWSNGAVTQGVSLVSAGVYTVGLLDSLGCASSFTVEIHEPDSLDAGAVLQSPTCAGEDNGRITLAPTGGTPPFQYSLNGGPLTGNRIFITLMAGDYRVSIRDAQGCVSETSGLLLNDPPPLLVDLGPDMIIPYGEYADLNPAISGGTVPYYYEWRPRDTLLLSCLNCPNPRVQPLFQRTLTLRVTDANGCMAEDLMTIFTEKDLQAYVPTGFTPNNDGLNDLLRVHGRAGVRVLSFRIFDRWGQLLYENGDFLVNDAGVGWDGNFRGQPSQADTYLWSMTIQSPEEDQQVLSGQTTLIR
jgi:gliding motility-associated-like protein